MKKIFCVFIGFFLFTYTAFGEGEEYYGKMQMSGEFLDGDLLKISVIASEMVRPVIGIAFHLNFDSEKLEFLKYEPGEFLERGGDPFYLVKNDISKIIFGETLRREDSFPVGDDVVAEFYFQILDESEYVFTFNNGVVSTLETVRQDIDKIDWEDFSVKRGDSEKVIDFGSGALSLVKNNVFDISKFFPWLLVILGLSGSLFLYFFWKKQVKKRP